MKSEQQIQKEILNYLKSIDYLAFKIMQSNKNGCPDILACSPDGVFTALEVKTPTGRVTPLQQHYLTEVEFHCGVSGVVRSVEDVKRLLHGS